MHFDDIKDWRDPVEYARFIEDCKKYQDYHRRRDKAMPAWMPLKLWRWLARQKTPAMEFKYRIYDCAHSIQATEHEFIILWYLSIWGGWREVTRYTIEDNDLVEVPKPDFRFKHTMRH